MLCCLVWICECRRDIKADLKRVQFAFFAGKHSSKQINHFVIVKKPLQLAPFRNSAKLGQEMVAFGAPTGTPILLILRLSSH
jgi:hypothetical protein